MFTKQMKYIFLRKNNLEEKDNIKNLKHSIFDEMFTILFKNVSNDSFDIQINESFYTVKFKQSSNKSRNTYYLSLSTQGTDTQCAKVLNEVNNRLVKGAHRKEYHIILSFDCVSQYYCNKIYPKFNLFERKIRELIFCILIEPLGVKWYEATFPKEISSELAKLRLKQSDLIERALYEITISQLETYLFTPYREVASDDILDNQLNTSSVNKMTKEDIVEILEKSRAKSLWERFFEGTIKIDNLDSNLEVIRIYRNCVAHCKYFYEDDYIKCNKILNKLLRQIENATEAIEVRTFSSKDTIISLGAFSGISSFLSKELGDIFLPLVKAMSELLKVNIPKIEFDLPVTELSKYISEAAKIYNSSINSSFAELSKAISEASKIYNSNFNFPSAELSKAISEASKIYNSNFNFPSAELSKAISEASKINIPNFNFPSAELSKAISEASKLYNPISFKALELSKAISAVNKINIPNFNFPSTELSKDSEDNISTVNDSEEVEYQQINSEEDNTNNE